MLRKIVLCILILNFVFCANNKILIKKNKVKIYLAFFKNSTYKPKINETLTESLSQKIMSSDIFKLVNKKESYYLVRGNITNYSVAPKIYDYNDVIQMYKMSINVEISILKNKSNNKFKLIKTFNIVSSTIYSETNMSKETEEFAFNRLKDIASIKIYNLLRKQKYD